MSDRLSLFERPHLIAQDIDIVDGAIVLKHAANTISLEVSGDPRAAVAYLEELRNPNSARWSEGAAENPLLDELCACGWIGEGFARSQDDTHGDLGIAQAWLGNGLDGANGAMRATMTRFATEAVGLANSWSAFALVRDWPSWRSVASGAFACQLRNWQRTSPAALHAVAKTFAALAKCEAPSPASYPPPSAGVREALWQSCILAASETASPDVMDLPALEFAGGPAINLVTQAERATVALLESHGEDWISGILAEPDDVKKFAQATFLAQYHISLHYVACLAPLLRLRVGAEARSLFRAYYAEELGHEEHERAACRAVGLSDAQIDESTLPPLMGAYLDVMAYLAEIDPLPFCLCVIVAEGLPGRRKTLPEKIAHALGETGLDLGAHVEIDEALNHGQMARRLVRTFGTVGAADGTRALSRFLDVLYMSQAAWRELGVWSTAGLAPRVPFEPSMIELLLALEDARTRVLSAASTRGGAS